MSNQFWYLHFKNKAWNQLIPASLVAKFGYDDVVYDEDTGEEISRTPVHPTWKQLVQGNGPEGKPKIFGAWRLSNDNQDGVVKLMWLPNISRACEVDLLPNISVLSHDQAETLVLGANWQEAT